MYMWSTTCSGESACLQRPDNMDHVTQMVTIVAIFLSDKEKLHGKAMHVPLYPIQLNMQWYFHSHTKYMYYAYRSRNIHSQNIISVAFIAVSIPKTTTTADITLSSQPRPTFSCHHSIITALTPL